MAAGDDGAAFSFHELGIVGTVSCAVVHTDTPWLLDIDTVVLSVGYTFGALADAVRAEFPQAAWDAVELDGVTPERPTLIALGAPESPERPLRRAVLVSPHPGNHRDEVSLSSIQVATRSAVWAAAETNARSVGVPLLGTGALGMPVAEVAEVAVTAVRDALTELSERSSLRRLVFVCHSADDASVVRSAWLRARQRSTSGPPLPPLPESFQTEPGPVELAGGVSSDLVDPNTGIPLSQDQLDLAPYVSMLATVIVDHRTPTPLSVGLFGEWGSGKSYFMGLLRGQVAALARSGRPGYCGDVVQIGFNAWHYSDSNLWASLGDEIFRQLAGPGGSAQQRRARLREDLAARLDQRWQFEAATEQARATAAELRAELDDAVANQRVTARDLISALNGTPEFAEQLAVLWRRLGVRDEAERAELLAEQIHGTLAEADALRRAPNDRRGKLALTVSVVALLVVGVLAVLAPWLRTWLTGAVAVCAAVSGVALGAVARARAAVGSLRRMAGQLRAGLDPGAGTRPRPEVVEKLAALRRAEADQRVAEAQLNEVVAQVGELGRELAELTPGRRLYTFLAERAQGDSYRRNLGVISTIRRDFEELVGLLRDWRDDPAPGTSPVDRIVLYIDDLDRCGHRQVVEVLQAVNLLLALDLFIVVVGVDPRWLLRSLRSEYADILDAGAATSARDGLRVTPEDYLEKIINIPLVLPGIPDGGLHRLLRALADESAPALPPERPSAIVERLAPQVGAAAPGVLTPDLVERGSEIAAQRQPDEPVRAPQPLTDPELALLASLDLLVDTPRKAKRLFNQYRMLRATRDLSPAARFLGDEEHPGEYQAVVVLLGLLTANTRLFAQVVAAPERIPDAAGGLLARPPGTPWPGFVADLAPVEALGSWTNGIAGPVPVADVPDWVRLHRGLARVSERLTLTDLAVFQSWAPRVRRFSYLLPTDR